MNWWDAVAALLGGLAIGFAIGYHWTMRRVEKDDDA